MHATSARHWLRVAARTVWHVCWTACESVVMCTSRHTIPFMERSHGTVKKKKKRGKREERDLLHPRSFGERFQRERDVVKVEKSEVAHQFPFLLQLWVHRGEEFGDYASAGCSGFPHFAQRHRRWSQCLAYTRRTRASRRKLSRWSSIPKERILQRTSECTVEHFVGVPVPQIQERTLEVAEIIPQKRIGSVRQCLRKNGGT